MASRCIEATEAAEDKEDYVADKEVRIVDQDRLQHVHQQARSARGRKDVSHRPGDNNKEDTPQDAMIVPVMRCLMNPLLCVPRIIHL